MLVALGRLLLRKPTRPGGACRIQAIFEQPAHRLWYDDSVLGQGPVALIIIRLMWRMLGLSAIDSRLHGWRRLMMDAKLGITNTPFQLNDEPRANVAWLIRVPEKHLRAQQLRLILTNGFYGGVFGPKQLLKKGINKARDVHRPTQGRVKRQEWVLDTAHACFRFPGPFH